MWSHLTWAYGSVFTHIWSNLWFTLSLLWIDFNSWRYLLYHCYYARKVTKHLFSNRVENIAPAAKVIRRMKYFRIDLLGKPILAVILLEIDNVCIMTQVEIHCKIKPQPSGFTLGSALRNSLGLGF